MREDKNSGEAVRVFRKGTNNFSLHLNLLSVMRKAHISATGIQRSEFHAINSI